MLEKLIRSDGRRDIRSIRVSCSRGLRGDEENAAEVCENHMRSESLELRQELDEGLPHETMNKTVNTRVMHVRHARANPPPKVVDGQRGRALKISLDFVEQPCPDHGTEDGEGFG